MAMVLTVAQQKGGVGKTTLAANLAAAYAATASVALLDIDPQRSLTRWHTLRQEAKAAGSPYPRIAFSDVSGWRLPAELDRLRRNHEFVLIDSPPQIDTDARVAVRAADLVLIPLQPSPPDLWAAEGTLKLAEAERRRAVLVFNRAPAVSQLRSNIQSEITTRHLTLLPTALGNRIGFANAFAEGLGVTEASPRSTAATELRALLANLKDLMK